MTSGKWAVKAKGRDVYIAVQRFPGFTTCNREGNPGIYEVQVFDSEDEARKAIDRVPEDYTEDFQDDWEVIPWDKK